MGRVPSTVARHRLPFHRRALADPRSLRRWALVLIAAVATATLVGQVVVRAEQARSRWGSRRTAVVVDRPLAPGEPIGDAVRLEPWPLALLPAGAFTAVDAVPAGATAAGPLAPGTPLTDVAVTDPAGAAVRPRVAVPTGLAVLPLSPGDSVEVWATVVGSTGATGPETKRVTAGASVVGTDDETVVLAVDADDIEAVTEAAALATVTLVATG